MATEIERKFLVNNNDWRLFAKASNFIQQVYINKYVRIRGQGLVYSQDLSYKIGIKFPTRNSLVRKEYEFEIPSFLGKYLLGIFRKKMIQKIRHYVEIYGVTWEIDVFHNSLAPLVIAEVELSSIQQQITLPNWVGEEVTNDPKYLNCNLSKNI